MRTASHTAQERVHMISDHDCGVVHPSTFLSEVAQFIHTSKCGCRLKIGKGPLLGKALEFFTSQGGSAVSGRRSLLEAWTSAIELDVLSSGALVNKRMDLLVGSFSRGLLQWNCSVLLYAYMSLDA